MASSTLRQVKRTECRLMVPLLSMENGSFSPRLTALFVDDARTSDSPACQCLREILNEPKALEFSE